jgi:hypothetical protein
MLAYAAEEAERVRSSEHDSHRESGGLVGRFAGGWREL